MAENPNELMKPAGATPSGDEPVIHVIPEKFYGAALRKRVPKAMPTVAAPSAAPQPQAAPQKKGKTGLIIAIVAVLLLGGSAAAYFLLGAKKPAPVPVVVNTAPPAPICGDAKCDVPSETYENCKADCPPPPPVCGDRQCDANTENYNTCPADCPPPAPVCGDKKCEEPAESLTSCPEDCKKPEPTAGADADADGLTDEEETQLYHSNPNDPDTDKDSFLDNNEVLKLFDPVRPTPAMLRDNSGITIYTNAEQHYETFRPSNWSVKEDDAAKKTVFINAPSGETVTIAISEKPAAQAFMDWYLAQAPGVNSSQVTTYVTRQGYSAIISPDQFVHYVDLGNNRVAVVTYSLGARLEVQYRVTFQMMVQSFRQTQ
jgi:hypothetical protein